MCKAWSDVGEARIVGIRWECADAGNGKEAGAAMLQHRKSRRSRETEVRVVVLLLESRRR